MRGTLKRAAKFGAGEEKLIDQPKIEGRVPELDRHSSNRVMYASQSISPVFVLCHLGEYSLTQRRKCSRSSESFAMN